MSLFGFDKIKFESTTTVDNNPISFIYILKKLIKSSPVASSTPPVISDNDIYFMGYLNVNV